MFTFAVFLLWTLFGTALSGYYYPVADDQHLHLYQTEYAPEYDNYQPHDYKFEYAVNDPHTGDHKQQWEVKENGVVRGMYSLLEPDGTIRVVEYIADDHGFRATVKKLGHPIDPHHGAYHHQEQTHGLSLPEAYSSGYHGAYSGLAENYGTGTWTTPLTVHTPVHAPIHHAEIHTPIHHAEIHTPIHHTEIHAPIHHAEIHTQPIHVPEPVTLHAEPLALHVAEPIHVHTPIHESIHAPVHHESVHVHAPIHIPVHSVHSPIHLQNHHSTVEFHGFTGNLNDDSHYTNYGHENLIESHHHHQPEISHHSYTLGHIQSESAPSSYKTSSHAGSATSYVMQRQGGSW